MWQLLFPDPQDQFYIELPGHFRAFFFQAEDGIRDADVTGVQTCALPIYSWMKTWWSRAPAYLSWATSTATPSRIRSAASRTPVSLICLQSSCLPQSATRTCRSEEHTSELQSRPHLVCRLLLEKKKNGSAV